MATNSQPPDDHLAQQILLTSIPPPKSYDLNFLRSWIIRPKMGNLPIGGLDQSTWSLPSTSHDLLAISRRTSADPFSRWISNTAIPFLHLKLFRRFKTPIAEDPESEICHYEDDKVINFVQVLSTVIASILPISSIVVLYFVPNTLTRLLIVVGFTGLFALCLALTTRARRVEVFAATSAFAAVQVVFVTGNNGYIA